MLPLADVVFPAFFAPWVVQILVPVAGLLGLAMEVVFYWWWTKEERLGGLVAVVLIANVLSSVVGMIVAAQLPTGYRPAAQAGRDGSWRGAEWVDYFALSWVLAFIVSVLVEWLVLILCRRIVFIRRAGLASLFANACSYLVLLAVIFMSAR